MVRTWALVSCGLRQRPLGNGGHGMWPGKGILDEGLSTGSSELYLVFEGKRGRRLGCLCFLLSLQGEFARDLEFGIFGPDMEIPSVEGTSSPSVMHTFNKPSCYHHAPD